MGFRTRRVKGWFRELTPPVLWRLLHAAKSQGSPSTTEWEYVPDGWAAADRDPKIKGWNVVSVLEAYKRNWPTFLRKLEGTQPLTFSPESGFEEECPPLLSHNIMMTYAYGLALSTRQKSAISVLDWGGGIGHYYLISRRLVPDVEIDYHCKDVPLLAEHGRRILPNCHFYTDDSCLLRSYDFVFASGSLQYSRDWISILKSLARSTSGHLLLTRLPVVCRTPSFVILQRPYRYGYDTEYLGWCLNRDEVVGAAEGAGLELMREFFIGENPRVLNAPESCNYSGFLFRPASRNA